MINLSPALAAFVLSNRELMPLAADKHTARVRSEVAVACFCSLSQLASPVHQALEKAHEQLQSMKEPPGNGQLGLKPGLFTGFLLSVFPDSLSKVCHPAFCGSSAFTTCAQFRFRTALWSMQASFSKVLEGGSHEHVRAALEIMRGQLKCVWRMVAALRHQRHLCKNRATKEVDIRLTAGKSESCSEQIERVSDVVARGLKSKLPDAGVLHRLLLSLFPVLFGNAFEASGPAFPCGKSSGNNSTGHQSSPTAAAQQEAQGVRMNIDGMRLQLEDDSADSSSDEEPTHTLTMSEAECLSLLVLQVRAA